MRESLLVKDTMQDWFVWLIFKVSIKDDDSYINVDEKRGSSTRLRLDDRTGLGSPVMPIVLTFIGGILWSCLLGLSIVFIINQ